jgi:hypothetical protein
MVCQPGESASGEIYRTNEMSDYDPMDTTEMDALMKVKEMLEKPDHGIDGIVICIKYDPLGKGEGPSYCTGGGMTLLEALGALEFAKFESYQTMLNKKRDEQ